MKKQVPIIVVDNAYLNQTSAIPVTVLYTSVDGGFYLIASSQSVQDPANDDAIATARYSDGVTTYEIGLCGMPGPTPISPLIRVAAGTNIAFWTTADVLPGGHYDLFIKIIEV